MKIVKKILILSAVLISIGAALGGEPMKIKIIVSNKEIYAELDDCPAAEDLYVQLPLEIDLEDYASTEKIFYPPKKLSKKDAPSGYQASIGDITYYGPWGNIAIFYKNFSFASGLIKIGRITSGLDELKKINGKKVRIEKE